jgi:hypothetical protein
LPTPEGYPPSDPSHPNLAQVSAILVWHSRHRLSRSFSPCSFVPFGVE